VRVTAGVAESRPNGSLPPGLCDDDFIGMAANRLD